ncbi:olfactory receptor 52E8-like [Protopterus annectens]|uniref:olfactory receptor 52E8-like n=1 Tax=Protopterus annectens TaxID=7888 RepID=UPI001CFC156D|nr:olfactory receptor 52E8-like [Protopterus annectens]
MPANSSTGFHPKEFILTGFPGIEDKQHWLSIPFFIMYTMAVAGNATTILIIKTEQSLHEPMYLFICMLATIDVTLAITILSKLLAILWFDAKTITFEACIIQMFIIHFFTAMAASLLVVMAFDRYLAVCNPLRYPDIVTNKFVSIVFVIVIARSLGLILPLPVFAIEFPYCVTNIIPHCYCGVSDLINMACGNVDVPLFYVKCLFILMTMPDMVSIAILSFVLNNVHLYINVMAAVLYIVFPATLNPFIYCIRIKRIREKIKREGLQEESLLNLLAKVISFGLIICTLLHVEKWGKRLMIIFLRMTVQKTAGPF